MVIQLSNKLSALPVLLEENLVEAVLDGGKVEVRFGKDDTLRSGVDVETVLAEHVVPYGLLKMLMRKIYFGSSNWRLEIMKFS